MPLKKEVRAVTPDFKGNHVTGAERFEAYENGRLKAVFVQLPGGVPDGAARRKRKPGKKKKTRRS